MGWKNVKERYGIKHIVHVSPGWLIWIGSEYVPGLIKISHAEKELAWADHDYDVHSCKQVIGADLAVWRSQYLGRGEPFDGWVRMWANDPHELRYLIESPDTFERSIPVFTYDHDGNILQNECEELGWPNVTHDGCLMYDTFVPTEAEAVRMAKRSARSWVDSAERHVGQLSVELHKARGDWVKAVAASTKLDGAYPDIEPEDDDND